MKQNMVGWFEIPVDDMERAIKFYETILDVKISKQDFGGFLMGWFPFAEDKPGAAGTLVKQEAYVPSEKGTLIYFMSDDVQIELDRIEAAGGKIMQPKTQISPDHGFMALFLDTEGNRIALHSRV